MNTHNTFPDGRWQSRPTFQELERAGQKQFEPVGGAEKERAEAARLRMMQHESAGQTGSKTLASGGVGETTYPEEGNEQPDAAALLVESAIAGATPGPLASQFTKTDPSRFGTLPSEANGAEDSKGLERPGNKPLMRNPIKENVILRPIGADGNTLASRDAAGVHSMGTQRSSNRSMQNGTSPSFVPSSALASSNPDSDYAEWARMEAVKDSALFCKLSFIAAAISAVAFIVSVAVWLLT